MSEGHGTKKPTKKRLKKRLELVNMAVGAFEKTVKRLKNVGMHKKEAIQVAREMLGIHGGH